MTSAPADTKAVAARDQAVAPSAQRFSLPWFGDKLIRYAMVVVMVLIIMYFSYKSARFGTPANFQSIAVAAAPFALIALGQTLVILTGVSICPSAASSRWRRCHRLRLS